VIVISRVAGLTPENIARFRAKLPEPNLAMVKMSRLRNVDAALLPKQRLSGRL
jgi:hypothetical protein